MGRLTRPGDAEKDLCMRQKSIAIEDARDGGASLRVTRHPEQHKVVLSHWRERVCVASTPIELKDVPPLIAILAEALGDGIESPRVARREGQAGLAGVLSALRDWLRPRLAVVTDIRSSGYRRQRQERQRPSA
jgi:hypothetical protein